MIHCHLRLVLILLSRHLYVAEGILRVAALTLDTKVAVMNIISCMTAVTAFVWLPRSVIDQMTGMAFQVFVGAL
jgi:hypothetical protein